MQASNERNIKWMINVKVKLQNKASWKLMVTLET